MSEHPREIQRKMNMSDRQYPKLFYELRNREYHIFEPFKYEMAFYLDSHELVFFSKITEI